MTKKVKRGRWEGTLRNWGEFRLIKEVIRPILADISTNGLGDDCASVHLRELGDLVITTDVTPTPLAWYLGDRSYQTLGWYTGLINASDLAAAGVEGIALSNSVEAPADMAVSDLRDFFIGLADFCRVFSIPNAGGNIRENLKFVCHATAIGVTCGSSKALVRSGCRAGDTIVSVGTCGQFISAFLKARRKGLGKISRRERILLLRPRPPWAEMVALNQAGVISAASDNSDGLLGTLWNIAEASSCAIEINMNDELIPKNVSEAARSAGVNPWNLMFFWGDWQTVVAVQKDKYDRFFQEAADRSIPFTVLGRALNGEPAIQGLFKGSRRRLRILRNEAFKSKSFGSDPAQHILNMLRSSLFEESEFEESESEKNGR